MGKIISCKAYDIYINEADALNTMIQKLNPSRIFVLVDENTGQHCLHHLIANLDQPFTTITIPAGETFKNIDTCKQVWAALIETKADRKSLLINLGGGVIGDLGGFCAATYMRGITFIQMPTTLLSQVDASVGGKLGVDFDGYKNMVGLFSEPAAVIINTEFLKTLPYKELLSGYAELLKHGLIADELVWEELSAIDDITSLNFEQVVHDSVKIKKDVTEQDPTEKGLRKILNFGHTIGHAIETLSFKTDQPLLHGEAIAIGMIMESYLALEKGFIVIDDYQYIKSSIINLYGHKYKSVPKVDDIIAVMLLDKKNSQGKIMFSLLEKIGTANFNQEVEYDLIEKAREDYMN